MFKPGDKVIRTRPVTATMLRKLVMGKVYTVESVTDNNLRLKLKDIDSMYGISNFKLVKVRRNVPDVSSG